MKQTIFLGSQRKPDVMLILVCNRIDDFAICGI